jgi:hypothetical protein
MLPSQVRDAHVLGAFQSTIMLPSQVRDAHVLGAFQSTPTNGGNVYHRMAEMCTIEWQK